MTTGPATVGPDDSVVHAKDLLESKGIHHLPVVVSGALVGMLSSSDFLKLHVLRAKPKALAAIKVSQIMESEPATLDMCADLVDVAQKLADGGLHALPVVDADNLLVGIVTSTDLINHLLRQVPRNDCSLRQQNEPESTHRATGAAMHTALQAAREAVRCGKDDAMAAALLVLRDENRLLREVSKAAQHYMRSGHAEHEHTVLVRTLAELQRLADD